MCKQAHLTPPPKKNANIWVMDLRAYIIIYYTVKYWINSNNN